LRILTSLRLLHWSHLVLCTPLNLYGLLSIESFMKPNIHPKYSILEATCSCGNIIKTMSTIGGNIQIEICSKCHPFYTGKQKNIDSAGRIDKFNKRFGGIKR